MSKEIINVQMDKEYYEKVINNVPQEGGGGESSMEYLDVKSLDDNIKSPLIALSARVRMNAPAEGATPGGIMIIPICFMGTMNGDAIMQELLTQALPMTEAVAVDFDPNVLFGDEYSLIGMMRMFFGINNAKEILASIPRITKEEFYNTEA